MITSDDSTAIEIDNTAKPTPAAFAQARATRPEICGSDAPERPYPIYLRGTVERGFGRGGKDLGCPTANLPSKVLQAQSHLNRTGVYYGFARVVAQDPDDPDLIKGEEAIAEQQQAEASNNGQVEILDSYDDPKDEEWEVDEDEIILSASPTGSIPGQGGLGGDGGLLEAGRTKPRQSSRSSARSFRGLSSALERVASATSARSGKESSTASTIPSRGEDMIANLPTTPQIKQEDAPRIEPTGEAIHLNESTTLSRNASLRRRTKIHVPISDKDQTVFPMVMSIGWNPFYKNTVKTAEVHIMHDFESDFYGLEMRVVVLGYIRPEYNYVSKEALIDDIDIDKKVAHNSLARNLYQDYARDPFLLASI